MQIILSTEFRSRFSALHPSFSMPWQLHCNNEVKVIEHCLRTARDSKLDKTSVKSGDWLLHRKKWLLYPCLGKTTGSVHIVCDSDAPSPRKDQCCWALMGLFPTVNIFIKHVDETFSSYLVSYSRNLCHWVGTHLIRNTEDWKQTQVTELEHGLLAENGY